MARGGWGGTAVAVDVNLFPININLLPINHLGSFALCVHGVTDCRVRACRGLFNRVPFVLLTRQRHTQFY